MRARKRLSPSLVCKRVDPETGLATKFRLGGLGSIESYGEVVDYGDRRMRARKKSGKKSKARLVESEG